MLIWGKSIFFLFVFKKNYNGVHVVVVGGGGVTSADCDTWLIKYEAENVKFKEKQRNCCCLD